MAARFLCHLEVRPLLKLAADMALATRPQQWPMPVYRLARDSVRVAEAYLPPALQLIFGHEDLKAVRLGRFYAPP